MPLVIVTRVAAYACPVARRIYDDLARTGSPVAWRLRATQRASIEVGGARVGREERMRVKRLNQKTKRGVGMHPRYSSGYFFFFASLDGN